MQSDSPASDDDNQKSDDDDGKQDVVMDEIDEQNKEDVCKEARSIRENKCVEIRLTFKRRAWRKKSVMDNENKDAEAIKLSSSIKRCGHPMKHSYNLNVKDTGDQTAEHNDANEDTGNTDSDFVDIRDEQNNDDSDLSNNADAKSKKEDEEFDALAITICNVCHPVPLYSESEKEEFDFGGVTDYEEKYDPKKDTDYTGEFYKSPYELKPIEPKISVSASEKIVADTLFAMMYKPSEIVFEMYKGFKVLEIEMETLEIGLDVHYEVINAWCDVLNTIEKDRKDYDKTVRKYCFKNGFLQANFLDKNVDANIKVKNFKKKLKEAVNNDTTLMKLQQIQFHFYVICFDLQSGSFVLFENSFVENDSADRDIGIPKALHSIFVDFLQSIEHRNYKKLRRAKWEVVKLDFKKRNDHADYGIIVMTAMDCYMGEVKTLKDMFLEGIPYTQVVNLRQMIATKIMMSKINIRKNVYQRRIKSNSKKKNIDSFVCNDYDDSIDEVEPNIILKEFVKDINKSSAEYTKDNSNDEDNKDSHSAEEEENTKDSDSVKTTPVKKRGRPKKIVKANENKSLSVKTRGRTRKSNDESKKKTIGSKRKGKEYKVEDDDDNDRTKRMKKKMYHKEAKALFNAMAVLNVDRKKCLYEMGFGSMTGMAIHELLGMLGFCVIDNLNTETNVLSLTDNSILVTSQSVHDILEIPMGGCSLESLESKSPDDPFIKEWFSQFGDKNKVRPNDITDVIVSTKDAVIPHHEKKPYHIINDRKPSVKFFHIFGSVCYIVRDGENLDKMKEKGDECIFMGYSTQSRAYRVFNKRTRVNMESIHVNFDELPLMASDQNNYDPAPECQTMALIHESLSPAIQRQENVPQADRTVTKSNELDLLFSLMLDELISGSSKVVSKSSAVSADDALNQHQQYITPLTNHTTLAPIYQGETSSRHVDSSNMHTLYQQYPSEHRWTKDHPLEQVIGNPLQSVRTRRQVESDAEMCMFAFIVSRTKPKNIKEAMADSVWIESMQEELHQFDRLDVWELIDRPLCTNVINLKWLWKNKRDEENTVIRNKSWLVAK
uniref:Integrase, catalytic region, zinc finger, CCHC-type, peptidase aspartic, catalytic n=1 Tax=Tanacetum cinerariifolium TaxID=118510 RepID=A0A6L2NXQ3_TANCI|nr:integrase, catalytic region, zinc finger, CCHC-type, peptidase aspartic, catalytic [Tanacetum cinerariifolium]